jgi:predicted GNAT family acetyltransferase
MASLWVTHPVGTAMTLLACTDREPLCRDKALTQSVRTMIVTFSNMDRNVAGMVSQQLKTRNKDANEPLEVHALANEHQQEVLAFLSRRPIHTVCMAGYVRDHGVVSPLNRGTFYGCRTRTGALQGVALIGHATLLETQSDEALKAFAKLKHHYANSHLIRGEHSMIERFWSHYAELGHELRLACRELLFEQKRVPEIEGPIPELRPATPAELEEVMRINAELIQSECGIDPLKRDLAGFRNRLLLRIQQGRIWTFRSDNRLIFKADVFSETPQMAYVEGVFVDRLYRGKGHGLRCMAQLGRILLQKSNSICLLINERNRRLKSFYTKAGYRFRGCYDTIYLHREN